LRHVGGRGEEEVGKAQGEKLCVIELLYSLFDDMIATSFADLVSCALLLHLFLHCQRIRKYEEED